MAVGDIFPGARFKRTLCRGESLAARFRVSQNAGAACGVAVLGDPLALGDFALSVSARVAGTDRVVPMQVRKDVEGSATVPGEFSLLATPQSLALAFEEGALQTIEVLVTASRVNVTFTLLKGTIRMKPSSSGVGAP